MPYQNNQKTVIAKEYPVSFDEDHEPYYPILTNDSKKQYEMYYADAKKYKNLFIVGRLAEFKYYNMDQAVKSALEAYEIIKKYHNN